MRYGSVYDQKWAGWREIANGELEIANGELEREGRLS